MFENVAYARSSEPNIFGGSFAKRVTVAGVSPTTNTIRSTHSQDKTSRKKSKRGFKKPAKPCLLEKSH